jgi:predicted MFS family arabinose efflux permease
VLEPFRDERYRLLWLTGLCANTARWMDVVVLGWLALTLTDSPLMVGVAAFCRAAPMMAFGPFAGVLADRLPRVHVMSVVQVLNIAAAMVLALLFAAGLGGFAVLVGIEVILGIAWVLDFPSRRTVLFVVAGRDRLTAAVSLETMSMQAAKMVGPLLGGVLLARMGPAACYLAFAALSVGAFVATRRLGRRISLPGTPGVEPVLESLRAGLREARGHPAVLGVLVVTVLMNTLVFPYQQMLPVFARDVLRVGPVPLGLLVAAQGLGALVSSLAIGLRGGEVSRGRLFVGSSLTGALLLLAFAASPWYALSLALQFAIGLTDSGFGTMQARSCCSSAPERARPRHGDPSRPASGPNPSAASGSGFVTSSGRAPRDRPQRPALAVTPRSP